MAHAHLDEGDIRNILFESDNEGDTDPEYEVGGNSDYSSNHTSDVTEDGSASEESGSDENGYEPRPNAAQIRRPRSDVCNWIWSENLDQANNPRKFDFTGTPGITAAYKHTVNGDSIEIDLYRCLLRQEFWSFVALETNRYASQFLNLQTRRLTVLTSEWFDTTSDEIQAYFSLCVIMGQVRKNTLLSYWSARACTSTPFFGQVMSYRRFLLLSKFLHFKNNDEIDQSKRLGKIQPVVDYLNKVFPEVFVPEENVGLDESLMKFRGRLCYVQYNPSKRARFGIKFYKLCQSSSGYCFQFSIYVGKKPANVGDGIPTLASTAIVMELMEPYLGIGHTIYLDNWYTSPTLFLKLIENETNAVGTVRVNRKLMPKNQLTEKKLKKGEATAFFSHDMTLIKWIDKKPVHVLSTFHAATQLTDTGKISRKTNVNIVKPKAVLDYNQYMNAVDRQDQQLASFPIMRRYAKGYKKIFFYIMDIAMYNSYVLYKTVTGKKLHYSDYRVNLAEQILETVILPEYKRRGRPMLGCTPVRLQAANWGHFARHIPPNPKKQKPTRVCHVCKAKKLKSESRFECDKCQVALHMPECFKLYHTLKKY